MDNDIIITCHKGCRYIDEHTPTWSPSFDRHPWKSCSYCGSMHPDYVLEVLKEGAKLYGADWKYGWPHKFYIEVSNPDPQKVFELGSKWEAGVKVETYTGTLSTLRGKWYNEHLLDIGVPSKLFKILEEKSGVRFEIKENQLYYWAPYDGFQVG